MKKNLILIAALLLVSFTAEAGTWSSPVQDGPGIRITSLDSQATIAGTPYKVPASGSCTTGQTYYYYQTGSWLYRFNVGTGVLTVYKQTCI